MNSLIELDHVTKAFGGLIAVKELSFQVGEGLIVGLIGPNGSGKTTVFNLISGVYKPDKGSILFAGRKVSGKKPHVMAQLGVGRTFQTVRPFSTMNVIENVAVGGLFGRNHSLSVGRANDKAEEILAYVGLTEKSRMPAGALTLAEQRRLELGRALSANPRFLMLDELMAGLTHTEISQTLDFLRRLSQERGITLLVIEHVMKAIIQLCENVVVLDHGEKIAEGSPSQVISDEKVIRAYMGEKATRGKDQSPFCGKADRSPKTDN